MEFEVTAMKAAWNKRAQKNAYFYVETEFFDKANPDGFFFLGEERSQALIDPVLGKSEGNKRGGTALDIGCGVGRFSRALSSRFVNVVGVDVSGEMIAQAMAANAAYPNITFIEGDGLRLPVGDHTIDFVWSYEVFQHMPTRGVIEHNLKEISRVLKPTGTALIHFRTLQGYPRILRVVADLLPVSFLAFAKALLGKDRLTADKAWRGAPPMSVSEIRAACRRSNLSVVEFRPDPTNPPDITLFALVRPAGE